MSKTYIVVMRGERFTLTQDQVEFDSPNYFTSCFLGEFAESQTRTVALSRDPDLFRIIIDYLSGYTVLPLHESALPERMDTDVALANLLADAQFYLLDGLVDQIKTSEETSLASPPRLPSHVIVSMSGELSQTLSTWRMSAPVPISADTAQELKACYGGFKVGIVQGWEYLEPGLDEVLREAQLPTSYALTTVWSCKDTEPAEKCEMFFVLRLIM
ncbi:hypothetical protein FS749_008302 [Ceratobasidium sp. UAMH 11750]|nr:hypothetical protein FS749_008302 [Ceratobasidium sp. UAMH 11750]